MRIKLDENIPGAIAGVVRARGHDVDTVIEESLGGRDDPTVLAAATNEGRLLITLDRGFGDVRAYPPAHIRALSCCDPTTNVSRQ